MNADELQSLPLVVDLPTAARALGIGRTAAYQLVRTDTWPTPVLRLGNRIKIPTPPLLALLGLSTPTNEPVPDSGHQENDRETHHAHGMEDQ